ncbi:MAG: zinc ABC transporter solute-binding protein [Gammaproteobacteria bacterium]|nr:zinc ABC transporter solute-binding protein [Gammaproteobacteria bacterium]
MTIHLLLATRLLGFFFTVLSLSAWSTPPPKVVASIAPVYNLTSDIMAGVGEPMLIVSGFNSPHSYSMRPSSAKQLATADLILWIGKDMEPFLRRPLQNYGNSASIVTLIDTPGLSLLPYNQSNAHHDHPHSKNAIDTHIWLNPDNAIVISKAINQALAQVDPSNATRYQKNTTKLIAAIEQFSNKAKQSLLPVTAHAFMVYHDAYQYFTQFFALKQVAHVVLNPGRQPSAKQIKSIRKQIKTQHVRCIFTEPQFNTPIIKTLTENLQLRTSTLDPLGVKDAHKPYGYIAMMEANVDKILACLK